MQLAFVAKDTALHTHLSHLLHNLQDGREGPVVWAELQRFQDVVPGCKRRGAGETKEDQGEKRDCQSVSPHRGRIAAVGVGVGGASTLQRVGLPARPYSHNPQLAFTGGTES